MNKKRLKTFFKFFAASVAVMFVVLVGFLIYSLNSLPEPIRLKKAAESLSQTHVKETAPDQEFIAKNESAETRPALNSDVMDNKSNVSNTEEPHQQKINEKVFKNLREERFSDIRVCENLGNNSFVKLDDDLLIKSLSSQYRGDPIVEAFRIPMKGIFQSTPVKELLEELESISDVPESGEARSDFLKKAGFYAVASKKMYDLYRNKSEFERLGDRALHLQLISQIVLKKPELKNDKSISEFCREVESSIGAKYEIDIDEERKEVLKLIDYAGLTPEELEFNPNVKTKFHIDLKDNRVSFGFSRPDSDAKRQ